MAERGLVWRGEASLGWLGNKKLGGSYMVEKVEKVWKAGTQIPVKAEVACAAIVDLQKRLGKDSVTARELLDASRDENAPLHNCFEWDDSVAAEKYRLTQARHIISSVEIIIRRESDQPIVTRAFLNVKPPLPKVEGCFVSSDVVMTTPAYLNQVLKNALSELRAFQKKYQAYQELTGVFKAIDAFEDSLK